MEEQKLSQPRSGDVDQGWAILSVCWALVAAALVSTVLRIWIRVRLTHNLSWDDGIMTTAMVSFGLTSVHAVLLSHLTAVSRLPQLWEPHLLPQKSSMAWGDTSTISNPHNGGITRLLAGPIGCRSSSLSCSPKSQYVYSYCVL